MDKRLVAISIGCVAMGACAQNALFDYIQLNEDSPNSAFISRFSDSRSFVCYANGKAAFQIGVGIVSKGFSSDKEIEKQFFNKFGIAMNWDAASNYIQFDVGTNSKSGYKRSYVSLGRPLFDSNQDLQYMAVELINGKKVELTRFAQIPNFPFNTKTKRKPFFYYQAAGEPRYECGPIDQPD